MATGIFGFEAYPQAKSLDARKVGEMLRQRQEQQAPLQVEPGRDRAPIPSSLTAGEGEGTPAPEDGQAQLRAIGAMLSGTGQPMDRPLTEHSETATNAAIGSALTRLGNGGNPGRFNTVKPMRSNVERLRRLGVSGLEIELMSRSGAI